MKITLKGLLRHYLICLHSSIAVSLMAPESNDDAIKNVVFWSYSKLPTQQLKGLIDEVFNRCLKDRAVALHLKLLLSRNKPISTREMIVHLSLLHFACLPEMLRLLGERGLIKNQDISAGHAHAEPKILSQIEGMREIFCFGSDIQVNSIVDILSSGLDQMRLIATMNAGSEFAEHAFHRVTMNYPNIYMAHVKRLVFSEWSTACFVKDPTGANMWSVYGDSHRGACLSFNTEDLDGHRTLPLYLPIGVSSSRAGSSINHSWINLTLHDVDYSGAYMDINFFSAISPFTESQLRNDWFTGEDGTISPRFYELFDKAGNWRSDYWQKMHQLTLVKTSDWSHENESRLIYRSAIHDLSEPTNRLAKYKFSTLSGIIFGVKMTEEKRRETINIIRKKCQSEQRESFLFREAYLDHSSGKLRLRDLPLIKVT